MFEKEFCENIASFSCRGFEVLSPDMQINYSTVNNGEGVGFFFLSVKDGLAAGRTDGRADGRTNIHFFEI